MEPEINENKIKGITSNALQVENDLKTENPEIIRIPTKEPEKIPVEV